MKTTQLICAAALAGLYGCASSVDLPAEMNPAYANASYSNVLVVAEAPDREWRESLESLLVEELTGFSVAAIPAYATADGIAEGTDADAIIVVTVAETGIDEDWVEQRALSNQMTSNTLVSMSGSQTGAAGGSAPAQCKTTSQTGGGFLVKTPWAVIAISVVDRETRDVVWKSAVRYEGEARSDFGDLRKDYARTVARQMSRDGLW